MKTKKIIAIILLATILLSSLSGCKLVMRAEAYEPINNSKAIREAEKDTLKLQVLDAEYVEGLNRFAYDMFNSLREEENGENIFISPYSIAMALSLLYNCTDGNTRSELAALLGYDELANYTQDYSKNANEYTNANASYIMNSLNKSDKKVELNVANSIWLSKDNIFSDTLEESLLSPVRNYYKADIFKVDFALDNTLKGINNWVSDNTKEMIPGIFEEQSEIEELKLLLVNAIYFDGKWRYPFDEKDTKKEMFNGLTNSNMIDMMHKYKTKYRYFEVDGIRGLEMPYDDKQIVMDILIPQAPEKDHIGDLLSRLSNEELLELVDEFNHSDYTEINELAMPKLNLEYSPDSLKNILMNLGMREAFDYNLANLDLAGDNLYVDDICHKAKLEVDEEGTKAAAVTSVRITETSVMPEVKDIIDFIIDIPFTLIIRDSSTNTILFMGELNNIK